MGGQHVLVEAAGVSLHYFVSVIAAHLHDLLGKGLCHDVHFVVGGLYYSVLLHRVHGYGKVALKKVLYLLDSHLRHTQIKCGRVALGDIEVFHNTLPKNKIRGYFSIVDGDCQ